MEIAEFEHGKSRILAEAGDALRRRGIDQHSLMFDLHRTQPHPEGATLTVSVAGGTASGWFTAQEIHDSRERVARPDVRQKIASLVAGLSEAAA